MIGQSNYDASAVQGYLNYLSKDLVYKIDKAVDNPELSGEGLAERLARGEYTANVRHAITDEDVIPSHRKRRLEDD